MKNRSYWLGLAITWTTVLALYGFSADRRMVEVTYAFDSSRMPFIDYETIDRNFGLHHLLAGVKFELQQMGIALPDGSEVRLDPVGFEMVNSWAEHERFWKICEARGYDFGGYSRYVFRDLTLRVSGRYQFGIHETHLHRAEQWNPFREGYQTETYIYWGAVPVVINLGVRPFRIVPKWCTIGYRGPAWPAMLILTFVPYTLIFFLRRPIGRAIGGLLRRRRGA